jgi:3-oxoacyl-[acyl-carrier-protein] synthase-3
MTEVALAGYGRYVPDTVVTGREIAAQSGIPESVVTEKMGLVEKRVCRPDDDHVTDMCVEAGQRALTDADVDASAVDLLCYHGSEYKDHIVWSAAANVAERLGAENAYATESYTLCAGAPVALRQTRAELRADSPETALLVTASREEDLVEYGNERSSFMFNFGSGASACVLQTTEQATGSPRALVRESHAVTDGSFSEDVVMPAGGSREPPSTESVERGRHSLDVPNPDGMKRRLGPVSLPNYLEVADTALDRSGYDRTDLDFVAVTHMKRSFHDRLFDRLGLDPETDGYYLENYGHVQSADQLIAVDEALDRGRLGAGDLALFLAAGTGYTWAATVLDWRGTDRPVWHT